MHESKLKKSREVWKQKAIKKSKEANILRKEKKRLQESRILWKEKYKQLRRQQARLQSKDIGRHSYNSKIVAICICLKLYAQQSVRGISKSISIWLLVLGLQSKAPCHTTIHTWLRKSGYYRLMAPDEDSPQAQWVLFIDESMCMGREKLLLIMGVDIRNVKQGNLSFANSRCLYISSSNSWKGEDIAAVLDRVTQPLQGKICYAVTDRGNNINKALKLADMAYIHDLTHEMALYLSQLYRKSQDFKAYMQWTAYLRGKLVLSQWAHLMPPGQRSKARFHNIEPLYKWGKMVEKGINTWKKHNKGLYKEFKKITEFKLLLWELGALLTVMKKIKKLIASKGIKRSLLTHIYHLLAGLKRQRPMMFANKMKNYFQESLLRLNKKNIPVCCSDLIESAFGKFKLMMPANQWSGITDLALVIPAFMGKKWNPQQVKTALQRVKVKDYKQWGINNMEEALLKKRKKAFQKLEHL